MPATTMRGLLSLVLCVFYSHLVVSFVIPEADTFHAAPLNPIVEYVLTSQAQAQLRFIINSVDPQWGYPILHLDIGKAERQCHDTNVTFEAGKLQAPWLDHHASGEGHVAAYGNSPVSWTITCLLGAVDGEGDASASADVIHVLSMRLIASNDHGSVPGFTVAFKQSDRGPSILRFEPHYHQPEALNLDQEKWRSATAPFSIALPSLPTTSELPSSPKIPNAPTTPTDSSVPIHHPGTMVQQFADRLQESLSSKVQAIQQSTYDKLRKIKAKICPKAKEEALRFKAQHVLDTLNQPIEEDDSLGSEVDATASSNHQPNVNETRSIDSSSVTQDFDVLGQHSAGVPSGVVLKSFGLSLMAIALLAWLLIRCRDPRRRAERAARREERRTKRLYRRAARRQMIVNTIWNFRIKYGLVSRETLREDEKRRRVSEQDEVLATIFKDEIQSLRNAHRDVTTMTGSGMVDVEEGRSGYVYETDGLGRRRIRSVRSRSVSTLPEYEMEGSRPPSYRETSRRSSLAGFTTDSSVVSTSPRISRDGTNSDFDEKIEELDLRVTRDDVLGRIA